MRRLRPAVLGVSVLLIAALLPGAAPLNGPPLNIQQGSPGAVGASQALTPTTTAVPETVKGLDIDGKQIARTNYAIPAGAIFMAPTGNDRNPGTSASAPVKTLNRAIAAVPAGGTIVLRGGTYRDGYTREGHGNAPKINSKPLTLQAYPGEQPWLSGADVVPADRFTRSGHSWSLPWSTPSFCDGRYYERSPLNQNRDNSGPCAHIDFAKVQPGDLLPADPQQAFIDGVEQIQVASLKSVRPGTFYYDFAARKLHLGTNPAGRQVELTARPKALILGVPPGNQTRWSIKGIGIKQYASSPMSSIASGAIYIGGGIATVENTVFKQNAAGGLAFSTPGPGTRVTRSVFTQNGDTPLGGYGDRNGRTSNLVIDNNVFNRNVLTGLGVGCTLSCGQAAVKLAHMHGFSMRGNLVQDMGAGSAGLWCDLNCSRGTYAFNTIRNVGGIGIFHEVSDTGIIVGNVIAGAKAGIQVTSANTKVYNNTLLNIRQDVPIRVYDDSRTRGHRGTTNVGPDTRNVEVRNNFIAGANNQAYAVNPDATEEVTGNTMPAEYFTAFDDNYVVSSVPNQIFVSWRRDLRSPDQYFRAQHRSDFVNKFGYEKRSVWRQGYVAQTVPNWHRGDYRLNLTTDSLARVSRPPLPQDVADALGLKSTALPRPGAPVR